MFCPEQFGLDEILPPFFAARLAPSAKLGDVNCIGSSARATDACNKTTNSASDRNGKITVKFSTHVGFDGGPSAVGPEGMCRSLRLRQSSQQLSFGNALQQQFPNSQLDQVSKCGSVAHRVHLTEYCKEHSMKEAKLGGEFTFPGTDLTVRRMGYGAMQLAGHGVWGPPKDPVAAAAVLRAALAAGVNHIDTSDFYGPHITNQVIRQALHPYPKDLVIVTKLGARRPADKSWQPAIAPEQLTEGVHDNLKNLGLDVLDIVNYRVMGSGHGPEEGSIEPQIATLAGLKQRGLIRHIGISNATAKQVVEAQAITDIVCVQNNYNLAHREDDAMIDELARQGIAYVPFFPLGGFTPLQSSVLSSVAARIGQTPMQVALAWLLHRSPNILLIPGTSSLSHLHENLAAADLSLLAAALVELDAVAATATTH
jgi:pyridoxine 4-dehydrogenase